MNKRISGGLLLILFSIADCFAQTEFTTCLFDSIRNRPIPIAVYQPKKITKQTKVVIFNHGYDGNIVSNSNRTYYYLTRYLSEKGYYVISIQHELPNDPLLAMEGDYMQTRMPNWERGVENILFTIHEFRKLKPELDWKHLAVIGHSNGGDMTMLLAQKHPELMAKSISLDHRRMIIPRVSNPQIYTLRGCNYEADSSVIPTVEEQKKYNIIVRELNDVTHTDMGHRGNKKQHDLINEYLYYFLSH